MLIALVVEPRHIDASVVEKLLGLDWKVLRVETPEKAVMAIQTALFDAVVVPEVRASSLSYCALFSTLRLVAPRTSLVILNQEDVLAG